VDLGALGSLGKPMLVGDIDPSQGPVLVTVEYEVEPRQAEEFWRHSTNLHGCDGGRSFKVGRLSRY